MGYPVESRCWSTGEGTGETSRPGSLCPVLGSKVDRITPGTGIREYSWEINQYLREEMSMPRSSVRISRGDPGGAHGRGRRKRLWELKDCQNVKTCKDSMHEKKKRKRMEGLIPYI